MATRGRETGFCIAITYRATHRSLCSNSSPRKAFLSSPNHRTLRISLRVTFRLFPTLKMDLKGTRFATMEDIKSNATAALRRIPKEGFHRCFQQWQDRWSKCLFGQESYFEGDYVSVVICPTISVLYNISENFLTALRTSTYYPLNDT